MKRPSRIVSLPAAAVWAALLAVPARAATPAGSPPTAALGVSVLALASPGAREIAPEIEAVHYEAATDTSRPPPPYPAWFHAPTADFPDSKTRGAFDLYGGAYALKGQTTPTSSDLGFRSGLLVSDQVEIGLAVDWIFRYVAERTGAGTPYQEGGTTVTPERVVAESSSHLFPMSLFLQLKLPLGPIAPYAGVGGGYEVLNLTGQDYRTGQSRAATFGGFGWQVWAGMKLSLGGQVRLNGEAFLNQSIVERGILDPAGHTYQERVDVTGGGARLGLGFGF